MHKATLAKVPNNLSKFKNDAFSDEFDSLEVFDEIAPNHFLSEDVDPVVEVTLTYSNHDFESLIKYFTLCSW
jgi:hypothetical protein